MLHRFVFLMEKQWWGIETQLLTWCFFLMRYLITNLHNKQFSLSLSSLAVLMTIFVNIKLYLPFQWNWNGASLYSMETCPLTEFSSESLKMMWCWPVETCLVTLPSVIYLDPSWKKEFVEKFWCIYSSFLYSQFSCC